MHEADDAYMGYVGKDELIALLNESAGSGTRRGAGHARERTGCWQWPDRRVDAAIQQDEARWCAMLAASHQGAGRIPSPTVGAFYGKAMAIADLGERIIFLNRGQGWVVRKLREMLPRVRNDQLHADLSEMLRSHEANIVLAGEVSGRAL